MVFTDPAVVERVIIDKHMIDGRTVSSKITEPKQVTEKVLQSKTKDPTCFKGVMKVEESRGCG